MWEIDPGPAGRGARTQPLCYAILTKVSFFAFQAPRVPAEDHEGGQPTDRQPAASRSPSHPLSIKVRQLTASR